MPTGKNNPSSHFKEGNQASKKRGRPPGIRTPVLRMIDYFKDAEKTLTEVVEGILEIAMNKEHPIQHRMRAFELLASKSMPDLQGASVNVKLNPQSALEAIQENQGAIMDKIATGEITPVEAEGLKTLVEFQHKVYETSEIKSGMVELQQQLKDIADGK